MNLTKLPPTARQPEKSAEAPKAEKPAEVARSQSHRLANRGRRCPPRNHRLAKSRRKPDRPRRLGCRRNRLPPDPHFTAGQQGRPFENALLGLARVYRRQGSFTKAAAVYERFLKDYPTDVYVPDALLELGRTQRALGAAQLALSHFYNVINSTIKLSSENSEHYQVLAKTAQFEIAETHFQQGNFVEANKFYSRLRLLDLAPADRARAHFKSAYALYRGKDFEGAVKTINSYLDQWPQDENVPEARYLLSVSLRSLGQKQEALDATLALLRTEQSTKDPKRWSYWQRRTGNQLANDFFQSGDTLNALMIYQGLAALVNGTGMAIPSRLPNGPMLRAHENLRPRRHRLSKHCRRHETRGRRSLR